MQPGDHGEGYGCYSSWIPRHATLPGVSLASLCSKDNNLLRTPYKHVRDSQNLTNQSARYGLIQNIYKNTAKSSLIRNFCTLSLLYTFINGIAGFSTGGLQALLKAEADVFDDFLQVFRVSGGQVEDPRVQSIQALIQQ